MEMKKPSELKPWLKFDDAEYPPLSTTDCSVYQYIENCSKGYEGIAISYFDTEITYPEMFKNIQQTARAFRAHGVNKGDIVTICSIMTPEVIYIFYALDLIGATPNMTDPRTSAAGLHEYIEEVDSKFVISLDFAYKNIQKAVVGTNTEKVLVISPVETLPPFKQRLYFLKNRDKNKYDSNVVKWKEFFAAGEGGANIEPEYDPQHAAVIVHTGGTTGSPKGVLLSDKGLNALALQDRGYKTLPGETFLNIMPPFIAYGYGVGVHTPLTVKAKVVVIPKFEPEQFGKLLMKYKPTATAGVPAHYQVLSRDPYMRGKNLSFLKIAGAGGDGINTGAEKEVNKFLKDHHAPYKLAKGYGMTECCSQIVTSTHNRNKIGSVGLPMYYSEVGIFEPGTDKEIDFNEKGEICVSGPCLMLGYYNKPEETEAVLVKHSDGKTWLHTGDIGYMDEDGYIYIDARIKRVIIRHDGFKVFPTLIENVIGSHPDVATCSAVRISDSDHVQGDLPIVHVVLKAETTKTEDEVREELKAMAEDQLPEYVIPVAYIFRKEMPYTNIGKIDYRKLEMQFNETSELQ